MHVLSLKIILSSAPKGLVAEEDITELMLAAQKKATKIVLAVIILISGRANCTFIDDVPFYNFPYTFGYLFSMGIYAYANQQGTLLKTNTLRY